MRKEVDFLVIGSGVAGLTFALKAANFGKVLMVTKAKMDDGSTRYAQGGIASVVYQPDTYEKHIQDTMVAGDELSDRKIVELTIRESTERVMELVEWGVDFDKNKDGSFALAKEGGHSEFRVLNIRILPATRLRRNSSWRPKDIRTLRLLRTGLRWKSSPNTI